MNALQMDLWMHLELNIQMDTEADGFAGEPRWCGSMDVPWMDMWIHMDTVVIAMDIQQRYCTQLMYSHSVKFCGYTWTVLLLLLSF